MFLQVDDANEDEVDDDNPIEVDDTSWAEDNNDIIDDEFVDNKPKASANKRTGRFFLRSAIKLDCNDTYSGEEGDGILTFLSDDQETKVSLNGFVYTRNIFKGSHRYYRCWHKHCPGTMNTDKDMKEFKFKNLHFHPPEYLEIEKYKICMKIGQIAENFDDLTSDQIMDMALEGASSEVVDAIKENKKTVFANIRRKKKGAGKLTDMELNQRKRPIKSESPVKAKRTKMFIKDELKLTHTYKGDEGDNVLEVLHNGVVMNDFMYHKRRQDDNKIYWHCHRKDCHGTLITDGQALSGEAKLGHYHPKEPFYVEKIKALQQLKSMALRRMYESPSVLVKEMLRSISQDCNKIMPEQKSLCSTIARWRKGLK